MSVSYPLTPPSVPGFNQIDFQLITQAGLTRSEFTGQQQITQWAGQWWTIKFSLPMMDLIARAAAWKSFLSKLDGIVGTFYAGPETKAKIALGTATTATVNGAGQTGNAIALAGSGTLVEGQFIQLGSGSTARLHIIVTGGTLPYTADIRPSLRESPSNGSTVVLTNPVGVFRLANNSPGWTADRNKMYGFEFEAMEAI